MLAMTLHVPAPVETQPLHPEEREDPTPGAGEVLIEVLACGVCHTDLHIVEGELPSHRLPVVPGHQVVGWVRSAGAGVARVSRGDLVGVPWLNRVCGRCPYCLSGRENLCESPCFTGYDVDGGFAKLFCAHQEAVYDLPDGYQPLELAPLLCGGVIGYRAYQASGVPAGGVLGLFGFGSSAHLVLQMARLEGAEGAVFTRNPTHRQVARQLGAMFTGGSEETPPRLLDGAIVFAPAGNLVKRALELCRPGARVVHAGIYATAIPEIPYSLLYGERSVQSVTNSTQSDVRSFLALARRHHFQVEVESFPLQEANRVLRMLKESRIQASAVLVPPS
ncbi:MAG TPA: zinc-dependent alcohol dehydrogenase family protein [Atribacteraceae bacterium]|nr:zinc-dependent alcohol dehydrogenase family protein [Atribacteraceae bacterium]